MIKESDKQQPFLLKSDQREGIFVCHTMITPEVTITEDKGRYLKSPGNKSRHMVVIEGGICPL